MDKLTSTQQQEITRRSTEQLVTKLLKHGYDEETLRSLSRSQVIDEWAQVVVRRGEGNTEQDDDRNWEKVKFNREMELKEQELKLRERELMLREGELKLRR